MTIMDELTWTDERPTLDPLEATVMLVGTRDNGETCFHGWSTANASITVNGKPLNISEMDIEIDLEWQSVSVRVKE